MVKLLFSFYLLLSSYKHGVDKWKEILKCYSLNEREPLEIDTAR